MSAEELYSIKMRASKKENGTDVHISGAEKIVEAPDVDIFANALIERGMHHSKGEADALNLKINKVCKENIIYLDALSVETIEVETWEKGQEEIKKYLPLHRNGYTLTCAAGKHVANAPAARSRC